LTSIEQSHESPHLNAVLPASPQIRCLILGCGSTLRGDDGIGPVLCAWAEERFASEPSVRILARHQFTPELAAEIAGAPSVLFVDCSIETEPGQILLREIAPADSSEISTHHLGPSELLALARDLYNSTPNRAALFTVGAASLDLGEELSPAVRAALPEAREILELAVRQFLR
jgi:hydrogenase maturation protease